MSTGYCHRTLKRLSTNIFDTMKLKNLFHLGCDSPKYIAKLISLSIFLGILREKANTFRETRKLFEGRRGDECIIFRDQGSTDPPWGPHF